MIFIKATKNKLKYMSYKIAITGTGGGVGQSIIKSLYDTDYEIIALDGELLGAGLYTSPKSYLIPFANKPNYISSLLEICKKENISLLFPGIDAELAILSENRKLFETIGTKVIISSPDVVELSDNKQKMYDKLNNLGIIPFTTPLKELRLEDIKFPIIIKQMIGGARSKNVYLVNDIKEFNSLNNTIKSEIDNYIVQEYIEGDEYTCGSINLNNTCKGIIVMRRILRDGDTYKCFTENNPIVEDVVRKIVETIKPFGACNVQLRLKNNKPYIFEINARCSGTTASRSICGFNEPKMIADYLLKGIEPKFEIKQQTILRYWKELVVENDVINNLKENNTISLNNFSKL